MKYSIHDYAKALDRALAGPKADKDAIAKHFLALVRLNGDERRLAKIMNEASRLVLRRGGAREVVVASARPLTQAQKKSVHALAKPRDIVKDRIDTALVAGVKITMNDEMQFDGSLKAKLDALFKNS